MSSVYAWGYRPSSLSGLIRSSNTRHQNKDGKTPPYGHPLQTLIDLSIEPTFAKTPLLLSILTIHLTMDLSTPRILIHSSISECDALSNTPSIYQDGYQCFFYSGKYVMYSRIRRCAFLKRLQVHSIPSKRFLCVTQLTFPEPLIKRTRLIGLKGLATM